MRLSRKAKKSAITPANSKAKADAQRRPIPKISPRATVRLCHQERMFETSNATFSASIKAVMPEDAVQSGAIAPNDNLPPLAPVAS